MLGQTRRQWRVLGRMAVQDGVPTAEAPLACAHPEDTAACGGLSGLASAAARGVRRKQAHHLLRRGDGCSRHHPSGRLGANPLYQGDNLGQRGGELVARAGRLGSQDRADLRCWVTVAVVIVSSR
jgi:hypothetical protein